MNLESTSVTRSKCSKIALLRLIPFLFPAVFVCATVLQSISVLYIAVALHLLIIAAENTVGRLFLHSPIGRLGGHSSAFEDACLFLWTGSHLVSFTAVLWLVIHAEFSPRQAFALGAIFGYSINIFSATVGHELLHRNSLMTRLCSDFLFAAMLYPHFPAIHLASHHRWAGSSRDCQTPQPGQSIHGYLGRAFVGGWRAAWSKRAAVRDRHLLPRVVLTLLGCSATVLIGNSATIFALTQGLFSFILIETLNYIQHYKPTTTYETEDSRRLRLANQDLNFVSRCMLFNLSLHASHHSDQGDHFCDLMPVSGAPSYCWGYWTSFWLAWTPPVWKYLQLQRARKEA
jgi:alkane 1-monooxygenase